MTETVHIIEPTLSSEAGHCHSFVASLCQAGSVDQTQFRVWGGKQAGFPGLVAENLCLERFFYRKIRRLQELFLFRRLLAGPGRIFVSTAGRVDMVLLDLAASAGVPPNKVFFYMHWVRPTPRKLAFFRKMARRHPALVIMGPTPSVVEVFACCGFTNCLVVPYPITPRGTEQVPVTGFRHLLFAGAARQDKGFSHVVDLLSHLAAEGTAIPVTLQTSADHYDKYDAATKSDLERLAHLHYPQLAICPETLAASNYFALYNGAICLQPYNVQDFSDRISGITLDALSMGAPLVTLAGTWMARVVERFAAGIVITSPTPDQLLDAVQRIMAEYGRYQANACRAGRTLQEEHSASHLYALLTA
jgi:hypothetical protein